MFLKQWHAGKTGLAFKMQVSASEKIVEALMALQLYKVLGKLNG